MPRHHHHPKCTSAYEREADHAESTLPRCARRRRVLDRHQVGGPACAFPPTFIRGASVGVLKAAIKVDLELPRVAYCVRNDVTNAARVSLLDDENQHG